MQQRPLTLCLLIYFMHVEMSITFESGAYEMKKVMDHHEVPWGKEQIRVEYYVKMERMTN